MWVKVEESEKSVEGRGSVDESGREREGRGGCTVLWSCLCVICLLGEGESSVWLVVGVVKV